MNPCGERPPAEAKDHIRRSFDAQWEKSDLETAVQRCAQADVCPFIEKYLRPGGKILESGCGSGKWVHFFRRKGFFVVGLDWTRTAVGRAASFDAAALLVQGDAAEYPFSDSAFDLVLSLGTVEHDARGPARALREARRILKPGGHLVATVPALTPVRRLIYNAKRPFLLARSWREWLARRLKGKPFNRYGRGESAPAPRGTWAMWSRGPDGYHFFEYRFPPRLFENCLREAGFDIVETRLLYAEDGVFHDLAPLSGRWDFKDGRAVLSPLARAAARLFPRVFHHMVLCVGRKPAPEELP